MDIIVNPQRISRRTAATFTHGLGFAPAKKADVQAKAQNLLTFILSLQYPVKQYNAALKKVDPWWAQNFEAQLAAFYTFRDGIDTLAEGTADLQTADNTLDAMRANYDKLKKTLDSVMPNTGTGTGSGGSEPESGGTSPMIWVAAGLGVLALIALMSGEK
jgi:uncharacterized phage infection (PIP) family protein YhgE